MTDDRNIIHLKDARARAAGVSPEMADVIRQVNDRFGIEIDLNDRRLKRFKGLFPALSEAAALTHEIKISPARDHFRRAFHQGAEAGRAQMMMDVIICVLEQDGVLNRS